MSHGFTLIAVIRSIDTSFYRHIFINLRHGFLIARLSQNPYKHNEQIKKQNIDNSECFGVKFVKIYPEITSQ
jgi:hypothetical protein